MASAKDIRVEPISSADARRLIARLHYSGSFVSNSMLHLGVFIGGHCEGAMQFGPSMDKEKLIGIVRDTPWNGFLELNRMAFSERLPRNSESRALGVALRMIRKRAPHVQWIVSFADATICGDGTIYRAAGFVLTGLRENITIYEMPDGSRLTNLLLTADWEGEKVRNLCAKLGIAHRYYRLSEWRAIGAKLATGHQLRYQYFLDPTARDRLTVPILPFSAIAEAGVDMYRGEARGKQAMAGAPPEQRRGSNDRRAPASPTEGVGDEG